MLCPYFDASDVHDHKHAMYTARSTMLMSDLVQQWQSTVGSDKDHQLGKQSTVRQHHTRINCALAHILCSILA